MRTAASIDSMNSLTDVAIDIDDRLYEFAMEERYDTKSRGMAGTYTGGMSTSGRGAGPRFGNQRQQSDSYRPMPMELGSTQNRKGKAR